MKSYNVEALRGHNYDDHEFQLDMAKSGINIPDSLLYTPDIGPYVINAIYQQNISGLPTVVNDATNRNYTQEEAKQEADTLKSAAMQAYNALIK
jgi:hypothetical protein